MPLNMKNINNFTQWKKSGSVKVMVTHAIMHQKHLAQSGRSTRSVVDIFNTLRVFTKEPIRGQEIKLACMNNIQSMFLLRPHDMPILQCSSKIGTKLFGKIDVFDDSNVNQNTQELDDQCAGVINVLKYKEYIVYHKDMKMKCVLIKNLEKRSESWPMTYFTILVNHLCNCNLLKDQYIVILLLLLLIIIIYGICNVPLPKDTKRRKQYNKNKQNRLRIKVSFKMRLEYGNRRSTADVWGWCSISREQPLKRLCHRHICCFWEPGGWDRGQCVL